MAQITEVKGDLFGSGDSLAHCVSVDLKMGAGIAVGFKQRFGRLKELAAQNPRVGSCLVLEDGKRCIFYLVTKERYFGKPTLATLRAALKSLAIELEKRGIANLSIPRLGCGLDRLAWADVAALIKETLPQTCAVLVYSL